VGEEQREKTRERTACLIRDKSGEEARERRVEMVREMESSVLFLHPLSFF